MTRHLCLILALFLLTPMLFAQSPVRDDATQTETALRDSKLPGGTTVRDSKGRVIENGGWNSNGSLKFRYTGKLTRDAQGNLTCSGEIKEVANPSSQGSVGPITINTNGEPTTIDLGKNGTSPGGNLTNTILGGNATVNVSGNFNDVAVGGTGNNVNVTGNHNSGSGVGASSGGNVTFGGRGNSWTANGGSWVTRN